MGAFRFQSRMVRKIGVRPAFFVISDHHWPQCLHYQQDALRRRWRIAQIGGLTPELKKTVQMQDVRVASQVTEVLHYHEGLVVIFLIDLVALCDLSEHPRACLREEDRGQACVFCHFGSSLASVPS